MGDQAHLAALAVTAPRKLALLVGINQYPEAALAGCTTDVELQRELLINRFGFESGAILTLTNKEATRQNIEDAFQSHLIAQAQSGDLVVFHFSGYGSRVKKINDGLNLPQGTPEKYQNSLVPVDSSIAPETPIVNDLLFDTLWSLWRSLKTETAIAILDTSYTPSTSGTIGNLRIRSRPYLPVGNPNPAEITLQADLNQQAIAQTGNSGIILTASGPNQIAVEAQWNGFSAGIFTYTFTQNLWLATSPTTLQFSLSRAVEAIAQITGNIQVPQVWSETPSLVDPTLTPTDLRLLTDSLLPIPAVGVVKTVGDDGKTARLWLGGLPPILLDVYGINSLFTSIPINNDDLAEPVGMQVRSHDGLTAQVNLVGNGQIKIGQLVRESIRIIPRQIDLVVAIDPSLTRIERVDATSAFATIAHVTSIVPSETPQLADYVFGRVPSTPIAQTPTTPLPAIPQGSYGLFSLGQELIPNTLGVGGEAVKSAVQRVIPNLQKLRAVKLLRVTANQGSSGLAVGATLAKILPQPQILIERSTLADHPNSPVAEIATVPIGSRIQYQLHNYSDIPIYFMLLGLDSSGRAIAFYRLSSSNSPEDPSQIATVQQPAPILPGTTLTLPTSYGDLDWDIRGPSGLVETQIIFSLAPFQHTLNVLAGGMLPIPGTQQMGVLFKPFEVVQAILQDLHEVSVNKTTNPIATEDYVLDVNTWATLTFIYQIK